jgi:hypothetical protein
MRSGFGGVKWENDLKVLTRHLLTMCRLPSGDATAKSDRHFSTFTSATQRPGINTRPAHTTTHYRLPEVEVNLRPTVSRPVCFGVRRPSGTRDQFFFLLEISFRQLRVCYFIAPSLTRGRVRWHSLFIGTQVTRKTSFTLEHVDAASLVTRTTVRRRPEKLFQHTRA